MNLKEFFYQDYYHFEANVEVKERGQTVTRHRKFDLKKSGDDTVWKPIKEYNEPLLKLANAKLCNFRLSTAASECLDFQKISGRTVQQIQLTTTYPGLFTGSGYNHETGNTGELSLGFFFDHTTGLPILPGSSVKGVLRSVFPRFDKSDDPLINKPGSDLQKNKARFVAKQFKIEAADEANLFEKIHRLELAIFEGVDFQATEIARAEAQDKGQKDVEKIVCYQPMPKHDVFLDAFISRAGKDGKILGTDAITPHGNDPLKNPIPLPFLKVLPEVGFTFQFLLRDTLLDEQTVISADTKREVFGIILTTFGAGAKTNVGYGQFTGEQSSYDTQRGDNRADSKPTEPQVFDRRPRMGDPIQALVIAPGKVHIRTKTEIWEAKMTGNCPAVGTVVNGKINGIDKSGKVNQISYQGDAK